MTDQNARQTIGGERLPQLRDFRTGCGCVNDMCIDASTMTNTILILTCTLNVNGATRRDATRRDATRRDATRRDATRRDATLYFPGSGNSFAAFVKNTGVK